MSGLSEIIQWVEDNMDIDPTETPQEVFNAIDKDFTDNNRSDLANILNEDMPKFMRFIEQKLHPTIMRKPTITPIEEPSIIDKVVNFIRGIFR